MYCFIKRTDLKKILEHYSDEEGSILTMSYYDTNASKMTTQALDLMKKQAHVIRMSLWRSGAGVDRGVTSSPSLQRDSGHKGC